MNEDKVIEYLLFGNSVKPNTQSTKKPKKTHTPASQYTQKTKPYLIYL